MTAHSDAGDAIAFWTQVVGDARRTLCCEPHRVDAVQGAVDAAGMAGILTVIGSPYCPPGKLIVIDDPALEAAERAWFQHSLKSWKFRL